MIAQLHSPEKFLDITGCRLTWVSPASILLRLSFTHLRKVRLATKARSCRERRHRGQKKISVGFHLLSGRDMGVLPADLIANRCVGHGSGSVQQTTLLGGWFAVYSRLQ